MLRVYNTLTRKKEDFETLDSDHEYVVISDSKFEKDKEAVSLETSPIRSIRAGRVVLRS